MPKRLTTKPSPLKNSFSVNENESDDLNTELDQGLIALRQLIVTNPTPTNPKRNMILSKPRRSLTWHDRVRRTTNAKIPQATTENFGIDLKQHKQNIEQKLSALENEVKELRGLYSSKYTQATVPTIPHFEVSAMSLIHNPVLRLWKRALIIRPYLEKITNKEGKVLLLVAQENAKSMPVWVKVVDILKKIRLSRYNAPVKQIHRLQCALDWEDSEQIHYILSTIKPETNTDIQALLELTAKLEYLSAIMRNIHIVKKISPYFWRLIFAYLAKVAKNANEADLLLIQDCVRAGFFTEHIKNAVGYDIFVNGHFLKGNPAIAEILLRKEVIIETIGKLSAADAVELTISLPQYRAQILDAMDRIVRAASIDASVAPTFTPQRANQATSSSSANSAESPESRLDPLAEQLAVMSLK